MKRLCNLCEDIGLPQEIMQKVTALAETFDIKPYEVHMEALLSIETANEAYESIKTLLADDPLGIKMLLVQLTAALHTKKLYSKAGISDDVFIDTMKCYTRFCTEHYVTFGKYGFDRGWWTYRQLSLNLLRLGVLEFEMKHDENILSVHIPSDAVMTREALDVSYAWAKRFFAEKFGNFSYANIECDTWLLSPALRTLLPAGSRIVNFMDDYEILSSNEDAKDFMMWIYKKEYQDASLLPEETSLQKAVKQHLLNGGKIGNAHGRYKYESSK